MIKKKYGLVLVACLSMCFPIHSWAADEATTEVGIGFADESTNGEDPGKEKPKPEDPKKEDPKQDENNTEDSKKVGSNQEKVTNVLPSTSRNVSTYQSGKGTLPKTGEQDIRMFQFLGFGCITAVFWLSLYFHFKKEGNHE
ncbi:LPXTG cell wall anchor domain-containing protein [Enterococcus malodoratus]|uniref:LPXTG-domain-containing protein cell wall anchor domain n=1 Tax=Enterococcus malodoratus ATCC 43197 TaxID=1158601 RepID=R2NZP4_9ENTE|nr:LPXTG cell wall anchor domain-containing protein [Enterococcus malodoratus]EOH77512.1 LPXTG-domain-containing protein cell wall anchor domain [Enterococcus malodoratus ATCC 43197]EOT64074.1 hypothetical protein I585_03271 [Enterococcus malodoratus ATCC 43197]SPX00922.1 Uncharacterised protein [Enterococcus malodoratus]STD66130.1 Uncharacterised protein [Enterococcus malodoratus]